MKKAKKYAACAVASALIWTSLPQASFAGGVGMRGTGRTPAVGIAGLPPAARLQLVLNINLFLRQRDLSLPLSIDGFRFAEPERLVSSIGKQISQPGAAPAQVAAGKVILAALADPGFGTRIAADLEGFDHRRHPAVGKETAEALSALMSDYSGLAARSSAAKTLSDLHLDIPASLDTIFDGIKPIDAADSKHDSENRGGIDVEERGRRILSLSAPPANLFGHKKTKAVEALKAPGTGAGAINVPGGRRPVRVSLAAAAVAVLSFSAVAAMLAAGAVPALSLAGALILPKALSLMAAAGLIAYSASAHEWAHARAAFHYGDPTAKLAGRMTLNPLAHVDRGRSARARLSAWGFALGRVLSGMTMPVPVNPSLLKDDPRALAKLSLAGPLMSFVLALAFAGLALALPMAGLAILAPTFNSAALSNFMTSGLSLLPAAALDGGRIFGNRLDPAGSFLRRLPAPLVLGAGYAAAAALAFVCPFLAAFMLMWFHSLIFGRASPALSAASVPQYPFPRRYTEETSSADSGDGGASASVQALPEWELERELGVR